MKKVAVILSGCGVYDGSEIHEAVLTLLAIEQHGGKYRCFAPNVNQHHVVNHFTGQVSEESRNVLVESARIARGDIEEVTDLNVNDFDVLIVPGGFGAVKNLCNFAIESEKCTMNAEVLVACQAFAQAEKPAGYLCIAPAMLPLIYPKGVQGTIGTEQGTAEAVTAMGLTHINCNVDEVVIDHTHKLVSTPAYMLATSISEAATGINKLVSAVFSLTPGK